MNPYDSAVSGVVAEGTNFLSALQSGFGDLQSAILLLIAAVFGFFWVVGRIRKAANSAK